MDFDIVLFWVVCSSCLAGLVVTWKQARFAVPGWIVLYAAVFLLSIAGWLGRLPAITYATAAVWFLLILLPALIGRLMSRQVVQQRYAAACRLARIICWLHPADGCRETLKLIGALHLAQQGDFTVASDVLRSVQEVKLPIRLAAIIQLYQLTGQWEELLLWHSQHSREIERYPQFLIVPLRVRGETGDVRGLVEFFDRHRQQIGRLNPATYRDMCRLLLFVFCGKRDAAERLFADSLALVPAPNRAFWLATADLYAGASESARRQLEELLPRANPLLRRAIERRLSRISVPVEPLDEAAERVVEEAAREHGHETTFAVRRSLFSKRARATQVLILLNIVMFVVETCRGGGTDSWVLYKLGALYPPALRGGQWWRLIASVFLHFGAVHLAMNMLGLWIVGPFVEYALGFRRFVLVYLLAGIASMAGVAMFGCQECLVVGASGCIMGLIGAAGALMLRGWLREKARPAKRYLILILLMVSMQAVFDCTVPEVSMTAHLSGACIGFAITLVLQDRLRQAGRQQSPN
jgi:rhomboid protease GluP